MASVSPRPVSDDSFLKINCARCRKDRMLNDGCGGHAGKAELLTGIVAHPREQDADRHVPLALRGARLGEAQSVAASRGRHGAHGEERPPPVCGGQRLKVKSGRPPLEKVLVKG